MEKTFNIIGDLLEISRSIQLGDISVVAGRPSIGKTNFVMNLAIDAAVRNQLGIIIFSLDLSAKQFYLRMTSLVSRIPCANLQTNSLTQSQLKRLNLALNILKSQNIYVEDSPHLTLTDIRKSCEILLSRNKISMIVIDYLQLLTQKHYLIVPDKEIEDIVQELKLLSKQTGLPIVLLSLSNRDLEQRYDKRPIITDLCNFSVVEPAANSILFIYRDAIYNENIRNVDALQIFVKKNNYGKTGVISVNCF